MLTSTLSTVKPARRLDLDWLRVIAILGVFLYHSLRLFDLEDWPVKNATLYDGIMVFKVFMLQWGMPLIFVISGASAFYALKPRGAGKYVKDRALRLLVPLTVGIFTHAMLQVYLERVSHGQFSGTFFEFIPHYFEGLYGFGGNFAWMGVHLWYLEILFVFSVLLLPLFYWLKLGGGQGVAQRLSMFFAKPLTVYALALPIMALSSLLDSDTFLGSHAFGGWNLPSYLVFFVYGFVVAPPAAVAQMIQRQRWLSLLLGVSLFVMLGAWWSAEGDPKYGTPQFVLVLALIGLSGWCWVLALLGFGRKHLNFYKPVLVYANEAVLPFYVLHQSMLVFIGYFVVQWPIPDLLKWALITSTAFLSIMALYEFAIRRVNVLRFLFGLRPLPHVPASRIASQTVA